MLEFEHILDLMRAAMMASYYWAAVEGSAMLAHERPIAVLRIRHSNGYPLKRIDNCARESANTR